MGKYCTLFVAVMLLLHFMVGVGRSIAENGVINVPYSTNIPRIDGNWTTPTEWQDASENMITNENENSTMYLRIKHNSTYIFVLMDFVTDHSNSSTDNAWIYFDTKDDGGDSPRRDDYHFDTTGFWQGSGNATPGGQWILLVPPPEGAVMEKSFSNLNDPYENNTPHEIYEFRVPCAFLGAGYSYGFYSAVIDSTHTPLHWPIPSVDQSIPAVWGDISSTVQFAPEWSPITAVALFSAVTVLTSILYKRRRASMR